MSSFQISSELSQLANHPRLPSSLMRRPTTPSSRNFKNNLLNNKLKFVNHIVFVFVSELETYGYKAEEIKEQLEQWFIAKVTSKSVVNVTCIAVHKALARIMQRIGEFRLFTSHLWLFFSGLYPLQFLLHDVRYKKKLYNSWIFNCYRLVSRSKFFKIWFQISLSCSQYY